MTNSTDTEPSSVASDQGLHCLLSPDFPIYYYYDYYCTTTVFIFYIILPGDVAIKQSTNELFSAEELYLIHRTKRQEDPDACDTGASVLEKRNKKKKHMVFRFWGFQMRMRSSLLGLQTCVFTRSVL